MSKRKKATAKAPASAPKSSPQKSEMADFEKLGAFYLGKEYDLTKGKLLDRLVMLDARDLTTHALCRNDWQRKDRSLYQPP
jgi:hypothetical protein